VIFTRIPLTVDTRIIKRFLRHRWKESIIKFYPELNNVAPENFDAAIVDIRAKRSAEIDASINRFQPAWKKIEEDCFGVLEEIVGTEWPADRQIEAAVSINPINPRFLDDWAFSIFYGLEIEQARRVIAHESLHFLYFKKWAEIHPETPRKNYEDPHIEWLLSELAAPLVLNDPRMQNILKVKSRFYLEHQAVIIEEKLAPEYFAEIYSRQIGKTDGFELFLDEAYESLIQHWPIL
jgi:hypothetical protein